MIRRLAVLLSCVAVTTGLVSGTGSAAASPCVLPVVGPVCAPHTVVLDGADLLRAKARLLAGDRTVRAALGNLLSQATAELGTGPWAVTDKTALPPSGDRHDYLSLAPYWWPTRPQTAANPWGCPYVQKDGLRDPIVDSIPDHAERGLAFTAIYQLALAWFYTGDHRYADRAELDLRTWFLDAATRMNPNLNYAQGIPCKVTGRGTGIIEFSYALTEVVDAVAILDAGAPNWSDADHTGMGDWFGSFLTWLETSPNAHDEAAATNNHGSFFDMMSAALALFTGQPATARNIVLQAETKRIAVQITATGQQPLETSRTRSWHYSTFNLVALTRLALIGRHVGVNLWRYQAPDGGSLGRAVDHLIPAATGGQSAWPYPELDFNQYAAKDDVHAAAVAGDRRAQAALAKIPDPPGGDLFPVRPAAEQLDDISDS